MYHIFGEVCCRDWSVPHALATARAQLGHVAVVAQVTPRTAASPWITCAWKVGGGKVPNWATIVLWGEELLRLGVWGTYSPELCKTRSVHIYKTTRLRTRLLSVLSRLAIDTPRVPAACIIHHDQNDIPRKSQQRRSRARNHHPTTCHPCWGKQSTHLPPFLSDSTRC